MLSLKIISALTILVSFKVFADNREFSDTEDDKATHSVASPQKPCILPNENPSKALMSSTNPGMRQDGEGKPEKAVKNMLPVDPSGAEGIMVAASSDPFGSPCQYR